MDPLLTSSPNGTHVGNKIEDYFDHGENSGKNRFFGFEMARSMKR